MALGARPAETPWQQGPHRIRIDVTQIGEGATPRARLPVFVLLDGEQYGEQASGIARELVDSRKLGGLLLVSVKVDGTAEQLRLARLRLFTTPVPVAYLPDRARSEGAATGEIDLFAERLRQHVRAATAQAGGDKRCMTLFGHSLAGHAALAIALRHGKEWRGTVAGSPSIWWGKEVLLRDPRLRKQGPRGGDLLLTAGALEATAESAGRFRIVENVRAFDQLARAHFRSVETLVLPGEDHQSSVGPALRAGLIRAGQCWHPRQK